MTYFNAIRYSDSGSLDAFARLRTSSSFTIFDSKQLNDKAPLFWDEVISNVSGNATSTHSTTDAATTMAVGANAGDYIIRQTKMRTNYQPGKSQLIIMTGVMSTQTGVTKRIGYFNSSIVAPHTANFDGVYFENDGTDVSINTAKNGTIDKITQANWNVDKMDGNGSSKITLDWSRAQIFFIDFEWLGVGRVRFGVFVNGVPYYVHADNHANLVTSVYMSSPNHSVRYEIRSDGSAGSLVHICSTVQSEGGLDQNGMIFSAGHTNTTSLPTSNDSDIYALVGIRLKTTHFGSTIIPRNISVATSTATDFRWALILNPTVAGTFTYADITNSSVQQATGTANTNKVTGGTQLQMGIVSTKADFVALDIDNAIRIGSTIDGVADSMVLCASRITGTNETFRGSIIFRDLQ
jgi:hypothetical protein